MEKISKGVMTLGIIFVILGIWGFFQNPILGLFLVGPVHNWVHLISGILAVIFASRGEVPAKQFAKVFGVIYGFLAITGFFITDPLYFGFLRANNADDWLHLFLAAAFLYLGYSRAYGVHRRGMREAPVRG